ncbi:AraC family transcriptional regulator [Janibacter corallicola]|uniref:AraC family transcriptional regulator n=1 Tax=Janibacter corallicola TaxID=415212 RepID=UPI000A053CF0|nr:AraC family transcriptional regulator [Janibacter corallicola]
MTTRTKGVTGDTNVVRAASLRGFVPLVIRLGGDPGGLLTRFGIDPAVLDEVDALIPITAHDRMLDTAAEELDCPDLGLQLAGEQDLGILGPLALAIESSSTVAEALEHASRYMFVHSPALHVELAADPRRVPGVVAITYRKDLRESPYSPQAMELGVALLHRIAVALLGGAAGLRSVEVSHAPLSPVDRYREVFGVEVGFNSPVSGLRASRQVLDRRFERSSPTIRAVAVAHLESAYTNPDERVAVRVRGLLAELLGTVPPTLAHVGDVLSVHPRTVQRQLATEGTSYEEILDDVRRTAALHWITSTDLPFAQVAPLVGLSEQSALTRSVRRWTGRSPRQLRREGRHTGT